jgi:hypothetical protein
MREEVRKDVLSGKRPEAPPDAKAAIPPEIQDQLFQEYMAKHNQHWLDDQIPALDQQTPRAAAQSSALRPRLVGLLKDIENQYLVALAAGEPAFDPTWMWDELGLADHQDAPRVRHPVWLGATSARWIPPVSSLGRFHPSAQRLHLWAQRRSAGRERIGSARGGCGPGRLNGGLACGRALRPQKTLTETSSVSNEVRAWLTERPCPASDRHPKNPRLFGTIGNVPKARTVGWQQAGRPIRLTGNGEERTPRNRKWASFVTYESFRGAHTVVSFRE